MSRFHPRPEPAPKPGPVIFLLPATNASFGGFLVVLVPDRLLGRFFATMQLIGLIVTPLLSLGVGFGLQEMGFRSTAFALIGLMALSALSAITYKPIRDIPKPDDWRTYLDKLPQTPTALTS